MRTIVLFALIAVLASMGCGPKVVSDAEAQRLKAEWSQEAYEKAMREQGREKELEEGRRRDEEYARGGYSGPDQAR